MADMNDWKIIGPTMRKILHKFEKAGLIERVASPEFAEAGQTIKIAW